MAGKGQSEEGRREARGRRKIKGESEGGNETGRKGRESGGRDKGGVDLASLQKSHAGE